MLSSHLSRDCRQNEDSNEADNKEDLNAGHFSGERDRQRLDSQADLARYLWRVHHVSSSIMQVKMMSHWFTAINTVIPLAIIRMLRYI